MRQPPNLLRTLNGARNFYVHKCNTPNCTACEFIYTSECSVIIYNKEIVINAKMSCLTKEVIYGLQCLCCNMVFVEYTKLTLKARITTHNLLITSMNHHLSYISEHLIHCKSSFRIYALFKVPKSTSTFVVKKVIHYFNSLLLDQ